MNRSPRPAGFTLIEMITVIAIIVILVSLVLAVNGLVQRKAAMSRTESEIRLLSQACEAYKTDNGGYPQDNQTTGSSSTNSLDPTVQYSPASASYYNAAHILYEALSGDTTGNGIPPFTGTNYAPDFFKPSRMAGGSGTGVALYPMDAYGNCFGYSTAGLLAQQEYMANLATTPSATLKTTPRTINGVQYTCPTNSIGFSGFNTTFDLWSTGGTTSGSASDIAKWVKNW